MEATALFPHQLFARHPSVRRGRPVYLVEDSRFFGDTRTNISFHTKKLVLHRASMKAFEAHLIQRGYEVHYIEHDSVKDGGGLSARLLKDGVRTLYIADPVDIFLIQRLTDETKRAGITLLIDSTPAFMTDPAWFTDFFKQAPHYSMTSFYIAQRKRLSVMLDEGKPVGGKWTFDTQNRERLPESAAIPPYRPPALNTFVDEAIDYVQKRFSHSQGDGSPFLYPITHQQASQALEDFLENRFSLFGKFQDAMRRDGFLLFHSLLSPSLNIGLLTPEEVVRSALTFAEHKKGKIPINSLEGFIRQIIGWREFVRAVYCLEGERQRTSNFWGHNRRLPDSFYTGTTGIEPVDNIVERVQDQAYCHHIERLMVLGNFMLLCEIHPTEVFRWFMEMFIDSYDWVMVPNVYGMSQYADGGLMTTKPYISSSRYILRMSNYKEGPWCEIWDALYWRFIDKHREVFRKIPRMSIMVSAFDRLPAPKRQRHLSMAEQFLARLT